MIHPLAEVQTEYVGKDTHVWQFSVILKGARIGNSCNINCHTFIESNVEIGNFVTIKSGVYLWDGLTVQDYVFIGPNVTFTNDKFPRSKFYPEQFQKTLIKRSASIGAAAIILGGITIGEYAVVGAGSLVTKDLPARSLVIGQPAKVIGWVNENGSPMVRINSNHFEDDQGRLWIVQENHIEPG
jgi:acetyltransferase-like isoleucine patch superfamily enzyme